MAGGTARVQTPAASSPASRARMVAAKGRDTQAEKELRCRLHAAGLRFRLHQRVLPASRRRVDIVFRRAKVAVFVDGCFWHSCPKHGTQPKANAAWWAAKLRANVQRDRETTRELRRAGWHVIRVWEHEDPQRAAARIEGVVRAAAAADCTRKRVRPVAAVRSHA